MGRGVGLPGTRGKTGTGISPEPGTPCGTSPDLTLQRSARDQVPPLTKVKLLVGRKQHISHFKTKLQKNPTNSGQRKRFLPRANPGNRNAATVGCEQPLRREGKILKQHRGTGLGLLLGLWESETVSKLDFILGQGFSMRETHMHFCFQNS